MTKVVFMGTPEFAVPALEALYKQFRVVLVVTQPDRPRGRGKKTAPGAVKAAARALGLPVLQPAAVRDREFAAALSALQPDFLVTAAYGRILPPAVLGVPKIAAVNIHASLLPRYRGAAPIHRAVINGDTETGITIMHMAKGMDTGDIISRQTVPVGPFATTGELHDVLSALGARMVVEALRALLQGTAARVRQDESAVTTAPPLAAGEEIIEWTASAKRIHNLVRGMNPWPGAYTFTKGGRLKIWSGRAEDMHGNAAAGTVLSAGAEGIRVAAGCGIYRIWELQPAGRRSMTAAEFLRGNSLAPGEILGRGCADGST
jgi:methionyl-tRNA formyltransferase